MAVKLVLLLFGLFAFSYGQLDVNLGGLLKDGQTIDIIQSVQDVLPQMNQLVESKDMSVVQLPDVKCRRKNQPPSFSGVTFEGLDKMTTALKGQATVRSLYTLVVNTVIVFEDTKLSAEKSTETGTDISWTIGNLTLAINFSLLPKHGSERKCFTKFSNVKIVGMSDILQESSNAEFDNKTPSTEAVDKVIRYYNQFLKNPKVLRRLSSRLDICEPPADASNIEAESTPTPQE